MLIKALFLASLGMAITVSSHALAAPTSRSVLVQKSDFKCFLGEVGKIPAEPRGVFVDIENCPTDGVRIVHNAITPIQGADPSKPEHVLYLKPADIACMRRYRADILRKLAASKNETYRLTLPPCLK